MRAALRAAEQTRPLRGHRVRSLDYRLVAVGLVALLIGSGAVLLTLGAPTPLVLAVPIALAVLVLGALSVLWARGVRASNAGVEALSLERLDAAEAGFRSIVVRPHPRAFTAVGLQNLAMTALRRGEVGDAVTLVHAALALAPPARPDTISAFAADHLRANGALVLVAGGDLDGAEALLALPGEPAALATSEALVVRSRALVLARRERWTECLEVLEGARALVRNALVGDDVTVVRVLRCWALRRTGAEVAPLAVDDQERAHVTRLLPGCEEILAQG